MTRNSKRKSTLPKWPSCTKDIDVDRSLEIKPGLFLPDAVGFYALDRNKHDSGNEAEHGGQSRCRRAAKSKKS